VPFDAPLQAKGYWLTSLFSVFLLFSGIGVETQEARTLLFTIAATASFFFWISSLKRYRAITDTPTSRIASAAQGYVELVGTAEALPGEQLRSKLTGFPCLWYRYEVERRLDDGKWEILDSGESFDTFALDDGSGICVIDPEQAEIVTSHKQAWVEHGYRKTEWTLIGGEQLYALGEHVTLGGPNTDLDRKQDVGELLAQWKKDKLRLAAFDADADGQIDMQEWNAVKKAAESHVDREHLEIRLRDGVHVLRHPRDGRLFLIANQSPEHITGRFRLWTWTHLTLLGTALGLLMLSPSL
jgi:hypothetical protein